MMNKEKMSYVYVSYIRASAEKVFEAIIKPEVSSCYWGHENISEWQVGSPWQHVRTNAERDVNIVGKVIEIVPPTRLVISWTNATQIDDPESYSRVTFEISEYEDMVRLTVHHEELEVGSNMAKGIMHGWPLVLSSLKSLLETGQGMDVFAKAKGSDTAACG